MLTVRDFHKSLRSRIANREGSNVTDAVTEKQVPGGLRKLHWIASRAATSNECVECTSL
jgi:hypothetical protein